MSDDRWKVEHVGSATLKAADLRDYAVVLSTKPATRVVFSWVFAANQEFPLILDIKGDGRVGAPIIVDVPQIQVHRDFAAPITRLRCTWRSKYHLQPGWRINVYFYRIYFSGCVIL